MSSRQKLLPKWKSCFEVHLSELGLNDFRITRFNDEKKQS